MHTFIWFSHCAAVYHLYAQLADNTFMAKDIILRWKYITEQCTQQNITVLSFGSDGDSRLMKSMKVSASFRIP